jgi:hypothetical protein
MNSRRLGALAALVAALGAAAQYLPEPVLDGWFDTGFPRWVPMLETYGTTFLVYTYLAELLAPLLTLGLALALGYRVGRDVDLGTEYRRVVGAAGAGSGLVALVVAAWIVSGSTSTGPFDAVDATIYLALTGRLLLDVAATVTAGVLAGAALAHFESERERAREPSGSADAAHDGTADADPNSA